MMVEISIFETLMSREGPPRYELVVNGSLEIFFNLCFND
jgi:hypothetical protein